MSAHPERREATWNGTGSRVVDVDSIGDAVVMIDASQRVLAFNSSACEMFGYEKAEVIGQPLDMLLPADAVDRHRDHVAAFAAADVAYGPMSRLRTLVGRRRNGVEFPIEITIGKTWVDGELLLSAVIRDVSDARRNESTQLARSEHLGAALQYATEGMIVTDRQFTILYASPFVERLHGASDGELVGRNIAEYVHPADVERNLAEFNRAREDGELVVHHQMRLRTAADQWIWVEATTSLTFDPRVDGLVTNFRDITAERTAKARRDAVAEFGLWALRSASLPDVMQRATDLVTEFLGAEVATVYERLTTERDHIIARAWSGWPQSPVGLVAPAPPDPPMGKTLATVDHFIVADYAQEAPFPGKQMLDDAGIKSSLGVVVAGDGVPWGAIGAMSTQLDQFDEGDIAFGQAVANVLAAALGRARLDAELLEQALRDPLTGLPNRALLNDRIARALAGLHRSPEERVAVLFVDIDNFKQVNDSLGHDAGDELLCEVGRRLRESVREEDTVARIGGDEFVIVTTLRSGLDDPLALAERIVASFHQPCQLTGSELYVTVSIGITISTGDGPGAADLLQDADVAMYEAKKLGRDRCVLYAGDLRAPLAVRASLEQDLHHALERDELMLYFQPVVNSDTGRNLGCEALLRWAHPERGLVSPGEFIPAMEETGMILPVGRWVIQRACQQLAQWQRDFERPDLTVSVNVSPRQLGDPELIPCIQRALTENGLTPSSLSIELTESTVVDDLERAQGTVEAIGALGVKLMIDDFGTGYSSLSYLTRLPVSVIKIDRSFITHICDDFGDQAIVRAVTTLAHDLGMFTVAEGVETACQLAVVRGLGCNLIQGFYYSRPLPASEFAAAWVAVCNLVAST